MLVKINNKHVEWKNYFYKKIIGNNYIFLFNNNVKIFPQT